MPRAAGGAQVTARSKAACALPGSPETAPWRHRGPRQMQAAQRRRMVRHGSAAQGNRARLDRAGLRQLVALDDADLQAATGHACTP